MNKFINLLFLLVMFSCKNEQASKPNFNFIKTFEGEIGDKYAVVMKIRVDEGKIEGNYYYRSSTDKLKIKGTIEKSGEILFSEFDTQGNQTGIFKGKLLDGAKLNGTWSKPSGEKEMNFTLIESNTNFEGLASEQTKKAKEKIETEKALDDDKERVKVDIKTYVTTKYNCKWKLLGGFSNLYVTLSNNTNYLVDEVKATLSVIKSNGTIHYTEEISFDKISAWDSQIVNLADGGRGNEIKIEIWKIKSKQLDLNYNTRE